MRSGINPIRLMKLKSEWEQFQKRHPKFLPFLQAAARDGFQENTVLEVTLTQPDGKKMTANLKLTAEDLTLLGELKGMSEHSEE